MLQTNKKSLPKLLLPFLLLILVIGGSTWLFFHNKELTRLNNSLSAQISESKTRILTINKNKNIQVYSLLEKNKDTLLRLHKYSQITKMMRDLDDIQSVYGLTFANISYSFGKARIGVHALWNYNENSTRGVYDSVQYFIENYRKDKNAHFDLGFITNFSHIKTTESQSVKMNIELQMK